MEFQNPHVALFASPGMGHLIPLVAFSKRLLSLFGFHSTIFVATTTTTTTDQTQFLDSLHLPSTIRIVYLPPPNITAFVTAHTAVVTRIHITVRESIPALRAALAVMSPQPSIFVVEMFGTRTFTVAEELRIPKYVYIPTTAAFLALMVYVPTLHKEIKGEYVDMQEPIRIPSCKPIRVEDLIDSMMDRKKEPYDYCVHMGSTLPQADAILINTWEDLEPITLRALREDPILREIMPIQIYPVGPIIMESSSCDQSHAECMTWLDQHPVESVIYVSFGSGGTLSEEQLTELAWGLELSQKRFLWVVRPPAGKDGSFFNLRGGDGAWPLFAEQRMNAAVVAEDVGAGVRTEELPTKKVVGREEIEKLVRLVMEKEGEEMRRRMKEVKKSGLRAIGEGGSSRDWLSYVAQQWKIGYAKIRQGMGEGLNGLTFYLQSAFLFSLSFFKSLRIIAVKRLHRQQAIAVAVEL
ncbi:hypothetical protein NE237_022682 [Protea cynaroides]|uniref:Uncharacterized protein n=1 Tax=Protea cynaroides TaxID=273540 RepID=A0A9Q0HAW1_9MAGN|nr:hypothetical protein NE237_022682 [Protea cynaroides]